MKQITNKQKNKKKQKNSNNNNNTLKSFESLHIIKPILKAIAQKRYQIPTAIQIESIPSIMTGKDIVAGSITGSGKTAAYLIPIIQRYYNVNPVGYIRVVIVSPSRQLAIQIYEQFNSINKYTKLDVVLVIGGSSITKQQQLLRNNPQVIIGTPGRIIDVLINSRSIGIQSLEMIIFDQADKLLQMGFKKDIQQIMSHINSEVQSILFSATINNKIKQLITITTKKPIKIFIDPDNKTSQKLHQQIIKLKQNYIEFRQAILLMILDKLYMKKVIVFFKTKKQCHRIAIILTLKGIKVCQLHGNMNQSQRIDAFIGFKEGKFQYLLATDLASRGLDIKDVETVINFELPNQLTRYIHRVGRTARAGSKGVSLTLCSDLQCLELKRMSRQTGDKLYKLDVKRQVIKQYQETIQFMEKDIADIMAQERQEMSLRRADMELKKLENITSHKDQIYSRPKKQWFMSQKEKMNIKIQSKMENQGRNQQIKNDDKKKQMKGKKRKQIKGKKFNKTKNINKKNSKYNHRKQRQKNHKR